MDLGNANRVDVDGVTHARLDEAQEVRSARLGLEADEIGAKKALCDLVAPRELSKQFDGRERDVEEESDLQIGAHLAQHLRDKLQLVVLHPDRRTFLSHLRGGFSEATVDDLVCRPPLSVELGEGDRVVIERPQRRVGEPFVVLLVLLGAQRNGDDVVTLVGELLDRLVSGSMPSDPRAALLAHHGFQGGHEAAWGRLPADVSLVVDHAIDSEAVGDNHKRSSH